MVVAAGGSETAGWPSRSTALCPAVAAAFAVALRWQPGPPQRAWPGRGGGSQRVLYCGGESYAFFSLALWPEKEEELRLVF